MNRRPAGTLRRSRLIGPGRVAILVLTAISAVALSPAVSHADSSSTITVVGTSDVFDSGLIQNVIKPDFEAATNHKYTLNYVSQGTGAAISYAEAGTASALLVHAASLENQFVHPCPSSATCPSYSYEQYGRAIFYGDYVLLGPAADPAGVMTGSDPSHDIVGAFQKIAAAGDAGTANFVSRGGTPGTTVEEHSIWALTNYPNVCSVSTTNGGGTTPSTATGACPSPVTPPSWYHVTGLTQGPNVVNADTCNYTGGNCYVLTDRGTYQYLVSQGSLHNLIVAGNDNAASSTGGQSLLVNSFHAYAINPAAFSGNTAQGINVAGAEAFLNWLTSTAGQAAVNAYNPGAAANPTFTAPFKEDAAPKLVVTSSATSVPGGTSVTISGSLSNKVPGTPPLSGVAMTLTSGGSTVETTDTAADGSYSFPAFPPTQSASYRVAAAAIAQVEIPLPTLDPLYGDLLQATSKAVKKGATIHVVAAPTITTLTSTKHGAITMKGALKPGVAGSDATLRVYATDSASKPPTLKAVADLSAGAGRYNLNFSLAPGHTWTVTAKYTNSGVISAGSSAPRTVTIA